MKLYNPKDFQDLYDYIETIQNQSIKKKLLCFFSNYNLIYIKLRELINDQKNQKQVYSELDSLNTENKKLKIEIQKLEKKLNNI